MKAAVLRGANTPMTIEDVELDGPRPQEVRIRVAASGLCHSDYHVVSGTVGLTFPAVLGHEASGVVEAVGEDVRGLAPGDRVVTSVSIYCGRCLDCQSGRNHLCSDKPVRQDAIVNSPIRQNGQPVTQFCNLGAFAEEMVVHETAVARLPDGMPFDVAALLGCAVVTGVGAATEGARVYPGAKVVVIGCGGVGLNAVQGARLAGAAQIVAIDVNPAKLELARVFGATDTVLAGDDAVAQVLEITGGGVDFAFDVVGSPAVMRQGSEMLRQRGTLVLVGLPSGDLNLAAVPIVVRELRVIGALMGAAPFQRLLPSFAQLYMDGRLLLDQLISQRIALEDINRGYEQMIAGEVARSVICFDA